MSASSVRAVVLNDDVGRAAVLMGWMEGRVYCRERRKRTQSSGWGRMRRAAAPPVQAHESVACRNSYLAWVSCKREFARPYLRSEKKMMLR